VLSTTARGTGVVVVVEINIRDDEPSPNLGQIRHCVSSVGHLQVYFFCFPSTRSKLMLHFRDSSVPCYGLDPAAYPNFDIYPNIIGVVVKRRIAGQYHLLFVSSRSRLLIL